MRNLLNKNVRQAIDSVSTYPEAKDIMNGHLFVSKAYIGGLVIATTTSSNRLSVRNAAAVRLTSDVPLGGGPGAAATGGPSIPRPNQVVARTS